QRGFLAGPYDELDGKREAVIGEAGGHRGGGLAGHAPEHVERSPPTRPTGDRDGAAALHYLGGLRRPREHRCEQRIMSVELLDPDDQRAFGGLETVEHAIADERAGPRERARPRLQ